MIDDLSGVNVVIAAARLENMLTFRGRVVDIGLQTVMPGDDAETQVQYKLSI